MSTKAPKRPRPGESMRGYPKKKMKIYKKQRNYHSSSEDESEEDSKDQPAKPQEAIEEDEESEDEETDSIARDDFDEADLEAASAPDNSDDGSTGDSDSEASTSATTRIRKRQDPDAFANSISKILSSKLTTSKRADPVLARSKDAATASKELAEAKIEAKARSKLRDDKRAALDKGRVKDVLALETTDQSTAKVLEEERKLKKMAQRGVVKLFNAVRAAQVKGEEAAKEARKSQVVGMDKREEMATEMSKQGFLDLIASGGKKSQPTTV